MLVIKHFVDIGGLLWKARGVCACDETSLCSHWWVVKGKKCLC